MRRTGRLEGVAARARLAGAGRQQGWLLVEAVIALTVLTVGVLGFLFSFQANFRASRELGNRDQVQAALESVAETLRVADFGTLYDTYQNSSFTATGVMSPYGDAAQVRVQFDVNEPTLPVEYGPLLDIDGDGARTSTNASGSYVLLPTRLTITYQASYGTETRTMYMVLGDT